MLYMYICEERYIVIYLYAKLILIPSLQPNPM